MANNSSWLPTTYRVGPPNRYTARVSPAGFTLATKLVTPSTDDVTAEEDSTVSEDDFFSATVRSSTKKIVKWTVATITTTQFPPTATTPPGTPPTTILSDARSSTSPFWTGTTTAATNVSLTNSSRLAAPCAGQDGDLFWIKVGLLSAVGVCLIMLCCMSWILAIVYCAYYKLRDGESSIESRSKQTKRQEPHDPTMMMDDGFKRLTVVRADNNNNNFLHTNNTKTQRLLRPPPAADATPKGSPGLGISTFSAHMAPPVPKSPTNMAVGMSPAEETPIRKGALDRMEQDEARRHADMMLMNDKSLAKRVHEAVNRERGSQKSKQRSRSKSRSKPSSKNPSFVVDKNTLKLVRIDGKTSKDMENQPGSTKGAVNIPFKF